MLSKKPLPTHNVQYIMCSTYYVLCKRLMNVIYSHKSLKINYKLLAERVTQLETLLEAPLEFVTACWGLNKPKY